MVFMTQSYNEECYASCENVQMPSTSGPVMDIMCGADNSVTCTADKWFTYMGSILNGYSPFNIFYTYTNSSEETVVDGDKVYIPLDPTIVPCDQPVPDTVIKRYIRGDCNNNPNKNIGGSSYNGYGDSNSNSNNIHYSYNNSCCEQLGIFLKNASYSRRMLPFFKKS